MDCVVPGGQAPYYRFPSLAGPHVIQGVFTRHGGTSLSPWNSLNVGSAVGDAPEAVAANMGRVLAALDVSGDHVVTAQQVHGCSVASVGPRDAGRVVGDTDGLVTADDGLLLIMRFADCVPVLFYAPDREVVAIAHAGWRGTLQGVAARTALVMRDAFDCDLAALRVGIGPSIGPCCYEVGADVYGPMLDRYGASAGVVAPQHSPGRARLDLWSAVLRQLAEVGVQHVEVAALCTCCRRDIFFSHRGDGGHTGRFAAAIGLRPTGAGADRAG